MNFRAPDVTRYKDICEYLNAYYAYRKQQHAGFSYQIWADELGFKDRSFLRMVVTGRRRISESNKVLFIEKMNFDELRKLYFSHLVSLCNASKESVREFHEQCLQGLLKLNQTRVSVEPIESIHSNPKIVALIILLGYEDVHKDLPTLANMLATSKSELSAWLKILVDHSYVVFDETTQTWKSRIQSLKVEDGQGAPITEFHRRSMEHAIASLELAKDTRKFRSSIVALSPGQLSDLWKRFSEFILENISHLEGQPLADRRLYQVNFNCVPASFRVGEEPKEERQIAII